MFFHSECVPLFTFSSMNCAHPLPVKLNNSTLPKTVSPFKYFFFSSGKELKRIPQIFPGYQRILTHLLDLPRNHWMCGWRTWAKGPSLCSVQRFWRWMNEGCSCHRSWLWWRREAVAEGSPDLPAAMVCCDTTFPSGTWNWKNTHIPWPRAPGDTWGWPKNPHPRGFPSWEWWMKNTESCLVETKAEEPPWLLHSALQT